MHTLTKPEQKLLDRYNNAKAKNAPRAELTKLRQQLWDRGVAWAAPDFPAEALAVTISDYPELDVIAIAIANQVFLSINTKSTQVTSTMPYKHQYILEEIIALLQAQV
jgi:hypothetical protein